VQALAIDPSSPATLYAGTASGGGVFKSTNGGTTWQPTGASPFLTVGGGLALAIDRTTPATIYAGTFAFGVFKSTNGGTSWTDINSGLTASTAQALAIDPSTHTTLYAGTDGGVFKSTNGGTSWTAFNSGLTPPSVQAIVINPATPTTIYAGAWNPGNFFTGGGVFGSANGGTSWTAFNSGLTGTDVQALAIDPSTPATIYAGTFGSNVAAYSVFKSTNGGTSWTAVSSGLPANTDVRALAIDPSSPATLYAGTAGGVYKSTNGGTSWQPTGTGIPACTYAISLASQSFSANGGTAVVSVTTDPSCHWGAASNNVFISILGFPTGIIDSHGNGSFAYTVQANTSSSQRTGTLTIAGQTFTVTQAGVATSSAPSITSGGVVPLNSSTATIQPGEWASIYGSNLAGGTVVWKGDFPVSLGGTSVTINGKLAYLWYVSPTQINFQAPNDTAAGTVPVVVTTGSGNSTSTVTLSQFGPSFSLLDSKHVTGIILRSNGLGSQGGGSYDIIGPTGSLLGYPTIAAKAGDTIELFGVGFGPTSPVVLAGQVFSGAAATTNPVKLLINNVSVTPAFAGLSSAGLYQINLAVPSGLGTGDVSLLASVGGVQTPSGIVISLQ
jgi:uncharacterized protein (TIGR03437 family)